jgi:hypothetical protein
MIAPAANNYLDVRGPLGDLGNMLLTVIGIAFACVLVRVGLKTASQHRAAREKLAEIAAAELAVADEDAQSRRISTACDTCLSSKLQLYGQGSSTFMLTV